MSLDNSGKKRGPYGRQGMEVRVDLDVKKKLKLALKKKQAEISSTDPHLSSTEPGSSERLTETGNVNMNQEGAADELSVVDLAATSTIDEELIDGEEMELDETKDNPYNPDAEYSDEDKEEDADTYKEDDDIFYDAQGDEVHLDESEIEDRDSKPLFQGSNVTVGAFMLLMALFFKTHNVVGDAIEQLLSIFAYILPLDNNVCTSLYGFNKYFNSLKNPLIYHYYCTHCLVPVEDELSDLCKNPKCQKALIRNELPYFLQIPIIYQVRTFFSHAGFFDSLQGRFENNRQQGELKDIYDGEIYQNLFKSNGPLSQPENLSFVLNTDGAPVFKSSNYSIWPIFLTINELGFKQRMMSQNMLLTGLWFGPKKPLMETYLKPLFEEFKILKNGIDCFSPERGQFISKGFLLCATADLPARALLCNSVQYNGAFGCWKCLQKGSSEERGDGRNYIFRFQENDPKGPKRTTQQALKDADTVRASTRKKCTVNGIKGMSWLSLVPAFDFVNGMAIDYMHGVLLGTQKLLLKLWFNKEFSAKAFSISSHVVEVDKRLLQVCPTLDVSRLPRSIGRDLKHWKASEFQNFLLYYGLPVLKGILNEEHWLHYSMLVYVIFILLQNGISDTDLRKADKLIISFCKSFGELYDNCFMTLNTHQLLHLVDCVRSLGPLYTHSCFPFEDKNGILMKMIQGTQNIDQQIVKGVSFLQKLPELRNTLVPTGSYLSHLCHSIEYPHVLKRRVEIQAGIYILGGFVNKKLTNSELAAYEKCIGMASVHETLPTFSRIELRGQIIYGTDYSRMKKRDNSTVLMKNTSEKFGKVICFHWNKTSNDVLAFVSLVKPIINEFKVNHIVPGRVSLDILVIPISAIDRLCLSVSFDDETFICQVPHTLLKV